MPDIYLICDNIAVFYTLYLCETLVLSADFEKPSAIRNQITLVRHAELMSNRQLGGKECLTIYSFLLSKVNYWCTF